MKALKFKDVEHSTWEYSDYDHPELYKIDWSRNEEKYKTPVRQVLRVYQGGRVNLLTDGYRNPDLRNTLLNKAGIDLRVTAAIKGFKFFTPDGVHVTKDSIKPPTLLLDHEHKMALTGRDIHWVDTGYAPKSSRQIICKMRNKEKELAFKTEWKEVLDLAVTMYSLRKSSAYVNPYTSRSNIRLWLKAPEALSYTTGESMLHCLGLMQLEYKKDFEKEIIEKCVTVSKFDYLKFEEV